MIETHLFKYSGKTSKVFRIDVDCFSCQGKGMRHMFLVKGWNARKSLWEYYAASTCSCQEADIQTRTTGEFWSSDMILRLLELFYSGSTNKDMSVQIAEEFDISQGVQRAKEYRSPCTKKLEKMRKAQVSQAWQTLFDQKTLMKDKIERAAVSAFSQRADKNPDMWKQFSK